MLSARMQRCSRLQIGSVSIQVRTRMGLGCKGEYFICMDNMDTLKNVFNFRCMIQDEKAKPFDEVK